MSDIFASTETGLDSPALHAFAVATSDSADLAIATRSIYVGVGGNIKVNMVGGETAVVFTAVPQGTTLPIRASRIYATGTTATNLVGLY